MPIQISERTVNAQRDDGPMTYHEIANIFPLLDEEALTRLTADIAANGLHDPITLHLDGRILDGRNRFRACERAGVTPAYHTWDGVGSALDFVISRNLHRRHLTDVQRALVAARVANLPRGSNQWNGVNSTTTDEISNETEDLSAEGSSIRQADAAALLTVSQSSVARGRIVIDHAVPELVASVHAGTVSLSAAAYVSKLPLDIQRQAVADGTVGSLAEAHRQAVKRPTAPPPPAPPVVVSLPRTTSGKQERIERMSAMAAEGYNTAQISAAVGMSEGVCRRNLQRAGVAIPGDVTRGVRRPKADRILEQTVTAAEHLTADIKLVVFSTLDRTKVPAWTHSLKQSVRKLGALIRRLEQLHEDENQHHHHETTIEDPDGADQPDAHTASPAHATGVSESSR